MLKKLRARWRKWRYARLSRKVMKLQSHICDELRVKVADLQEQLDAERITVRLLKQTIEQQEWVIARDRQRVKKEIAAFGGTNQEPAHDDERLRLS